MVSMLSITCIVAVSLFGKMKTLPRDICLSASSAVAHNAALKSRAQLTAIRICHNTEPGAFSYNRPGTAHEA